MHLLGQIGSRLFSQYKISHYTAWDPRSCVGMNLFTIYGNMLPKVYAATENLQRWGLLIDSKRLSHIQMPTVYHLSALAMGLTFANIVVAASEAERVAILGYKVNPINAYVVALEMLADSVSAIAAIGLIAAGSTASGSVVLFFLSVQVLDRFHLLPHDTYLVMTFIGHIGGIVTVPTYLEVALRVGLLGIICYVQYYFRLLPESHNCNTNNHMAESALHVSAKKVGLGISHPCLSEGYRTLGECLLFDKEFKKAKKCFIAASMVVKGDDPNQSYLQSVIKMGMNNFFNRKYGEALAFFSEAEKQLSNNQKLPAEVLRMMGLCLCKNKEHSRALEYLNQAITMRQEISQQLWSSIYEAKGAIQEEKGDLKGALATYEEGQKIIPADDTNKIGSFCQKRADCYYGLQNFSEAQKLYLEALEYYKKQKYSPILGRIDSYWRLGYLYRQQNKFEDALQIYEEGLSLAKGVSDRSHMASFMVGKGHCYLQQEKYSEAFVMAKEAKDILMQLPSKERADFAGVIELAHLLKGKIEGIEPFIQETQRQIEQRP